MDCALSRFLPYLIHLDQRASYPWARPVLFLPPLLFFPDDGVPSVSVNAPEVRKGESELLNSTDVLASIRDLILHLHRNNAPQAESIVTDVAGYLKGVMQSGADPASVEMQRTQQTMFAIDEVRMLLSQRDFDGAAVAARDAAKEWRQQPASKATLE